jgi:hypothetical protein
MYINIYLLIINHKSVLFDKHLTFPITKYFGFDIFTWPYEHNFQSHVFGDVYYVPKVAGARWHQKWIHQNQFQL